MQQGFVNEYAASPCAYNDYWLQASSPPQIADNLNRYDERIESLNASTKELQALDEEWTETKRRLETLMFQKYSSTMTQPHEACQELINNEDEVRDLDECYEDQCIVESCEDHEVQYVSELKIWTCEDSFDNELFYTEENKDVLHDNVLHVLEEITMDHDNPKCCENTMEECLTEESITAPTFTDFVDHVEMVVREYVKSDEEIILAMIVKHEVSWRQWNKRKKKRSIKSYLSIAPKLFKLLPRDHEISLKRIAHLKHPRPQPSHYS